MKRVNRFASSLVSAKNMLGGAWRAVAAGAAGAALMAGNIKNALHDKAPRLGGQSKSNNSREVITMKKSTWIALLVALAAVAGVLGALYVYVLRREKELDEYEQLLFSEDFNDDLPDDDDEDEDDDA